MSEDTDKPKKHWIEPAAAILMAATTVVTTWCSFQSSRWSGQSSSLATQAGRLDRKANLLAVEGQQVQAVHIEMFMGYVNAKHSGNEPLMRFYADRFGGELKPAFDRWLAQNPYENPRAAPHPFVTNLYEPRFIREIAETRAEAAQDDIEAGRTGDIAARYLSNTVMLAASLFFVGTSSRFESRRVRLYSFIFGAGILLYVALRLVRLPVAP